MLACLYVYMFVCVHVSRGCVSSVSVLLCVRVSVEGFQRVMLVCHQLTQSQRTGQSRDNAMLNRYELV